MVILQNAPILKFSLASFFAISILNPNYDVINDVISGFAKVVIERCGFHWFSSLDSSDDFMGRGGLRFSLSLIVPSYDVINDVIISDADCTPGREPRSVAASSVTYMHASATTYLGLYRARQLYKSISVISVSGDKGFVFTNV